MLNLDVAFENERVLAGFTTRFGGVSVGAYAGLNLGDHVGDLPQNVAKNREILASNLGLPLQNLKFMKQIHSNEVRILRNLNDELSPCDGLVTDLKGALLCVLVADCSPVLIADSVRGVVATVHAGRAGVVGRICTNAVKLMKSEFGCQSHDLRAFVGANIKGDCYEVGELNLGKFERYKNGGKFNMNAALKDEFAALGVRVKFSEICTYCDERYFSYRRDGVTGRFCGFAMLK
ncbi:polyphenol oxidase family protein [Campylobacter curvus]|uniref:polyphenol oxidase family protein n=1 Tax=Campylobacter curvus TaxID=200 RepID=UPI00146FDE36|nr:polyphenol oxidase family protein [Campylobacter curvus]